MNAGQLTEALRAHFIKEDEGYPGVVFLTEVAAPSGRGVRRADAVAVGLWSSRGYGVDVCEIKTSRADFRRELDDPAKAQAWWPHCSRFWLVSPGPEVTPTEMVPPGWGLMVPHAGHRRMRVLVRPEERRPDITMALLANLMTRVEAARLDGWERRERKIVDKHRAELGQLREDRSLNSLDQGTRTRLDMLAQLEQALGMRLDVFGWGDWGDRVTPQELGRAMAGLRPEVERQRSLDKLASLLSSVGKLAGQITSEVDGLSAGLST